MLLVLLVLLPTTNTSGVAAVEVLRHLGPTLSLGLLTLITWSVSRSWRSRTLLRVQDQRGPAHRGLQLSWRPRSCRGYIYLRLASRSGFSGEERLVW